MSWYLMKRGWMGHPAFKDEPFTQREAWEWLIANALYADATVNIMGNPVPLKRGQLSSSNRYLALIWKYHVGRVRRTLQHFEKWGFITTTTEAAQTVITVCNYDKYQSPQSSDETDMKQGRTQNRSNPNNRDDTNKKESKKIKERKEELSLDVSLAFEAYNDMAQKNGIPICQMHSTSRIQALNARLKECGGLDGWKSALEITAASDFLTGRKTGFKANIDFILQKSNFTKIMEGNYNNHPAPARNGATDEKQQFTGNNRRPQSAVEGVFTGFARAQMPDDISQF